MNAVQQLVEIVVPVHAAYLVAVPPVTAATFLANRTWTFADRN
jgi:hypothetical protein